MGVFLLALEAAPPDAVFGTPHVVHPTLANVVEVLAWPGVTVAEEHPFAATWIFYSVVLFFALWWTNQRLNSRRKLTAKS